MRLCFAGAIALAFSSVTCLAQQPMTNDTVTKMHSAGLGDGVIIATMNTQPGTYATTAADLIALKSAGISDNLIGAMISRNASSTPVEAVAATSGPSAADSGAPAPPVAASSLSTGPAPTPRVFLTSQSHGTNRNAVRDQSMEMSKDFERDCSGVRISLNQSAADYTVSLNHIEVGLFVRDNQFQIADRNGDLISTTKEGGSIAAGVKKACSLILTTWTNRPNRP
jgi:hypothetical protein